MKTILIILLASILVFLALFYGLGVLSRSGEPPGVINGKLTNCSGSPNCACSEEKNNPDLKIEPVVIGTISAEEALSVARGAIVELGGEVTSEDGEYIASVFISPVFGFADDFELRVDLSGKELHIRSASRVGHSDFGVNKKRADLFRALFHERLKKKSSNIEVKGAFYS